MKSYAEHYKGWLLAKVEEKQKVEQEKKAREERRAKARADREQRDAEPPVTPVKPPAEVTIVPATPTMPEPEPVPEPAGIYNNETSKANWNFEQMKYIELQKYVLRNQTSPTYDYSAKAKFLLLEVLKKYFAKKYKYTEDRGFVRVVTESSFNTEFKNTDSLSSYAGGGRTFLGALETKIKKGEAPDRFLTQTFIKNILYQWDGTARDLTGIPTQDILYKFLHLKK